jgi:hypothetical protein
MLQILAQGDDVFRLVERGGQPVGWVRGTTIRVGAFATEREALQAAVRGSGVVDEYLRGGPHRSAASDEGSRTGVPRDIRLIHDGAYEWIVAARHPIARLIRPRVPRRVERVPDAAPPAREAGARVPAPGATERDFALEFVVPASVPPATRVTLAGVLHGALAGGAAVGAGDAPAGPPSATPGVDVPCPPRSASGADGRAGSA